MRERRRGAVAWPSERFWGEVHLSEVVSEFRSRETHTVHAGFDERSRQFADDLKLPFDNALLYNEDTSDVANSARVMLAKCEELIESLRYEEPPEPEEPLLELPPAKKRRFAGRWAEDEEASLKELVKELGDNAWDQVAERLGTGRSARGAEQHWEVMRGTHAFARKRKGPPPKAPPKRSPKKEFESVWKSNFRRPTPSTRGRRRCYVCSMAWRFQAIEQT